MATIEDVKQYWDNRPCNIRHSKKSICSPEYTKEVTEKKYFVEPHIPKFADFDNFEGCLVLEIGCGIGTDTISFLKAGANVIAVDLSKNSIDVANIRIRRDDTTKDKLDHIILVNGNIEDKDTVNNIKISAGNFPDYSGEENTVIDLVYSFGVLHHTPNMRKAIENIAQMTEPGTPFKLMVYHRRSIRVLEILLSSFCAIVKGKVKFGKGFVDRLVALRSEAQYGCPITNTFTKESITEMLYPYFEPIVMQIEHIFPYQIQSYIKNEYKKKWIYRYMPTSWFRWLETHFGWHLCIDAVRTNKKVEVEHA